MIYETLVVDSVDLKTVVSCIEVLDGLYASAQSRGENVIIPGVDGEVYVDKPYATNIIDLGLSLAGSTTIEFNDAFRVLKTLIQPGRKLALERQISYTTGNESHFATGEWAKGLNPTIELMRFGRTTLSLKIHGGLWYADTATEFTVDAGTTEYDIAGETRTYKMTLTMPAGGTIGNVTSGGATFVSLSNTATGGDVTVDVLNMSAVQDVTDVSDTLSWTGCRYPFRLLPGPNFFTGDGFTVDYYPAYL